MLNNNEIDFLDECNEPNRDWESKFRKFLFDRKVNANILGQNGRPLHVVIKNKAPDSQKEEMLKELINNYGASVHEVDKSFKTPTQLVAEQKNAYLLRFLLSQRSSFTEIMLNKILDFCTSNYQDTPAISAQENNISMIAHYASRLATQHLGRWLNDNDYEQRDRYIVSIFSFNWAWRRTQQGPLYLEFWYHQYFLPLRIHALFEILVNLQKGLIKNYPINTSRETLINIVKNELLVEIEMLTLTKELCSIPTLLPTEHDPLYNVLAENVYNKIKHIPKGNHYAIATGWKTHAVIVQFSKKMDGTTSIIICNTWDTSFSSSSAAMTSLPYHSIDAMGMITPLCMATLDDQAFTNEKPSLLSYIKSLLQAPFLTEAQGKPTIYLLNSQGQADFQHPLRQYATTPPPLVSVPLQAAQNCVVMSHTAALVNRVDTKTVEWFLDQEKLLVVQQARTLASLKCHEDIFWEEKPLSIKRSIFTQPIKSLSLSIKNWRVLWLHEFLRALSPSLFSSKYKISLELFDLIANNGQLSHEHQIIFAELFPEAQAHSHTQAWLLTMIYHLNTLAEGNSLHMNSRPFNSEAPPSLTLFFSTLQKYQTRITFTTEAALKERLEEFEALINEIKDSYSEKNSYGRICRYIKDICHFLIAEISLALALAEKNEGLITYYNTAIDHATILSKSDLLFLKSMAQLQLGIIYHLFLNQENSNLYYNETINLLDNIIKELQSSNFIKSHFEYRQLSIIRGTIRSYLSLLTLSQPTHQLSGSILDDLEEHLRASLDTDLPVNTERTKEIFKQLEVYNWALRPEKKQDLENQLFTPRKNFSDIYIEHYVLALLYLSKYKIYKTDNFLEKAKEEIQTAKTKNLPDSEADLIEQFYKDTEKLSLIKDSSHEKPEPKRARIEPPPAASSPAP